MLTPSVQLYTAPQALCVDNLCLTNPARAAPKDGAWEFEVQRILALRHFKGSRCAGKGITYSNSPPDIVAVQPRSQSGLPVLSLCYAHGSGVVGLYYLIAFCAFHFHKFPFSFLSLKWGKLSVLLSELWRESHMCKHPPIKDIFRCQALPCRHHIPGWPT